MSSVDATPVLKTTTVPPGSSEVGTPPVQLAGLLQKPPAGPAQVWTAGARRSSKRSRQGRRGEPRRRMAKLLVPSRRGLHTAEGHGLSPRTGPADHSKPFAGGGK